MLTYTITGDNIPVTDKVRAHIEKRFKGFVRFMDEKTGHEIFVTLTKTTAYQREDSVRVEVKLKINTQDFFASAEAGDSMAAIDQAKEELMREVTHSKAKRLTLFHRGARKMKALMKSGLRRRS